MSMPRLCVFMNKIFLLVIKPDFKYMEVRDKSSAFS
jgi:hypothetical protein